MANTLFRSLIILSLAAVLIATALGLSGCVDEPSPVGSSLLPKSDLLLIDTLTIEAKHSFGLPALFPPFSPTRLMVGKIDEMQYESWGMIKFTIISDTLKGVKVEEADLLLRATYHFGDSLAPLSFRIHKALQNWGGDSLTYDSLKTAGFFTGTASPVAHFSSVGDSSTISARIDASIIQRWIDSVGTANPDNEGIILEPLNNSVIKGFGSFRAADSSHRPVLVVRYRRPPGGILESATITNGIDRYVATTKSTHFVSDSTRIFIRNGISYRGIIDFDVSSLPPRAPILRATLELTLDQALSKRNSYVLDSLQVFFMTKEGYFDDIFETMESKATVNGQVKYRLPLYSFVQRWVRGAHPARVAIAGINEKNSFDIFVFHGAASKDRSMRPKLIVTYSPIR